MTTTRQRLAGTPFQGKRLAGKRLAGRRLAGTRLPGMRLTRFGLAACLAGLAVLVATAVAAPEAAQAPPGSAPAQASSSRRALVICSPGSPGGTESAQSVMDDVARAIAVAAGRPEGSLTAVYHETLEAGVARMREPDAALAMVPLPFLLSHGDELKLTARLLAVPESGPVETWSLVAKKGRVSSPAGLAGWQIVGTAGYAERFVRRVALEGNALPPDATIAFTARALGALRRVSAGENVAVLLDAAQTAGLASLPFGADLEVLHRSRPLPAGFLCTVGNRLPAAESKAWLDALASLDRNDAGREALGLIQMTGFRPVDAKELDALRAAAAR
jgi:hypothetical protein